VCGIVGYVGVREAAPIVMDAMRRLEYRGYDSAGIAVVGPDGIARRRSVGKLDNLASVLSESPVQGCLGIGHTRWATHGKPSDANAHPHTDCTQSLVVIHNGIVENYVSLRQSLQAQGHTFTSETDTEVIPHLIEKYLAEGFSFEDSFRRMLADIKGAHAIVAMRRFEPHKLIGARLGNAGGLVVGFGEGETFLASDIPAILNHTRRVVFLDDGEMAVVNQDGAEFFSLDGVRLERTPQIVPWDAVAAAKGGYKHFMLKEIHEQSRSLTDTIRGRISLEPPEVILEGLNLADADLQSVHRVLIVACGTAWHAGLVGKFYLEELARLPVEVDYASEFRYRSPLVDKDTLVVAVTQSGETVDTLVSMEAAKRRGGRLIAIVNVVGSQASRLAEGVVYTHAGPEIGVASTKAFTSQLTALYLLALKLGKVRGTISDGDLSEMLQALSELPNLVGQVLARPYSYESLANRFYKRRDFLYLGRGIHYPIALEGALKLKEISYIHAEGYPAGEMKHGPIALIEEDMPVVAIAPNDLVYAKMVSNIEQVKARDGVVIALATDGDDYIATKADHVLYVPATTRHLSPILTVIPLQLLAYYVAVRRGADVDQPRNLAKSVTVE